MKKLLALVLALVMTLGLATVGTSAAFSDAASINGDYKEAVDVMNGIGVLVGDNGAFNPTGSLTREQGAKIIAYMVLGTTAADALKASKAPFADVAADRWSAGAIQYCVAQGIIAGVGENKFDPAGELTGYAFAKMALAALGYSAKDEKLVGSDWQLNTAKLAVSAGLTQNLSTVSLGGTLTREAAAQMGFNALKATMIYYDGGVSVSGSDVNVAVAGSRTAQPSTRVKDFRYPDTAADTALQLCELSFPTLKMTTDTDDFGAPSEKWVYDGTKINTYAATPVFTYTKSMLKDNSTTAANSTLKSDLSSFGIETGGFNIQVNGDDGAALAAATKGSIASGDLDDIAQATGNGVVTEIYDKDSDGLIDAVITKTYKLFEVTSKGTDSVILKSVSNGTTPRLEISTSTNKDFYDEVKDLAVGDYKMIAVNAKNAVVGTSTFTTATGAYTSKATKDGVDTYTVGGNTYNTSKVSSISKMTDNGVGSAVEYTIYLDAYGYITYAVANNAVKSTLAFVLSTGMDGNPTSGYTYKAKLLLADGSTKVVQVKNLKLTEDGAMNDLIGGAAGGFSGDTTKTYTVKNESALQEAFDDNKIKNVFVKFAENSDGTYILNDTNNYENYINAHANDNKGDVSGATGASGKLSSADNSIALSRIAQANKDAKFYGAVVIANYTSTAEAVNLNSSTKLVVAQSSGYKAFSGVKNFPNIIDLFTGTAMTDTSDVYKRSSTFAYAVNGYAQMLVALKQNPETADAGSVGVKYATIGLMETRNYLIFTDATPASATTAEDGTTTYTFDVIYNGAPTTFTSTEVENLGTAFDLYVNPSFDADGKLTDVGTNATTDGNKTYKSYFGWSKITSSANDGAILTKTSDGITFANVASGWTFDGTQSTDITNTQYTIASNCVYAVLNASGVKYIGVANGTYTFDQLAELTGDTFAPAGNNEEFFVTLDADGAVNGVYFIAI